MPARILPTREFNARLPDFTKVWYVGGFATKAQHDDVLYYKQSLFTKGTPQDIEEYLIERFGYIKPLTSIGKRLYDATPGHKRYGKYLRSHQIDYAEKLLLGGREYARPGVYDAVYHIDRNSAYPACCIDFPLPVPYFLRIKKDVHRDAAEKIIQNQDGFGFFKLVLTENVPVQGVLPVKQGMYHYPRGAGEQVEGVYTFNELRYAYEWGYRIRKAHWLFASRVSYPYLSQFQQECWKERHAANGVGLAIWKAIANKLIGRLAMKRREVKVVTRAGDVSVKRFTPPLLGNRVHAAMIAAEQRCVLHRVLTSVVNPVYAFTDSVVCVGVQGVQIGTGLGEWKLFSTEPVEYEVRGKGQYRSTNRRANRGLWLGGKG